MIARTQPLQDNATVAGMHVLRALTHTHTTRMLVDTLCSYKLLGERNLSSFPFEIHSASCKTHYPNCSLPRGYPPCPPVVMTVVVGGGVPPSSLVVMAVVVEGGSFVNWQSTDIRSV